jgi:hypothetical protein
VCILDAVTKKATDLTRRCRIALGRMAHRQSISLRTVSTDVRRELLGRGLVRESTTGYLTPTSRASGYTASPSTFEA